MTIRSSKNRLAFEVKLFGLNQEELKQSVKKVEQWLKSIPTTNPDEPITNYEFLFRNEVQQRMNRKSPARKPSMKHLVALAAAAITALATPFMIFALPQYITSLF